MRLWPRNFHVTRRLAVLAAVPLLAGAAVGGSYAVTGSMPFTSADDCEPSPTPSPSGSPSATDEGGSGVLSLSFSHQPAVLSPSGSVRWSFGVTNSGDETAVLQFSSGQNGDLTLTKGGVVYRWSDGQMFTQATRTVEIEPGGSWSFVLEDSLDLEPGTYSLKATVTSQPAPAPVTKQVQIGEAGPSPSATPRPSPSAEPSATPTETPEQP